MAQFLLIDASYYLFYRYHALIQWWRHARPDTKLENPIGNKEFMARFEKVFVNKIAEFIKKMKLDNPIIIIGQDCHMIHKCNSDIIATVKIDRI